jgi:hypothetical protein
LPGHCCDEPSSRCRCSFLSGPEFAIGLNFRERENTSASVDSIRTILEKVRWEVVFVDDNSSGGTADLAGSLGCRDASVRGAETVVTAD